MHQVASPIGFTADKQPRKASGRAIMHSNIFPLLPLVMGERAHSFLVDVALL